MEWLTSAASWVISNIALITQVIGTFSAIAVVTKNKSDDKIVDFILKAVNFLGANFGQSANKDE